MRRNFVGQVLSMAVLATGLGRVGLAGTDILVPNGSFETPAVPTGYPASPVVDSWSKAAEPIWWASSPLAGYGYTWTQMAGAFPNTAPTATDHIDNMAGAQAGYLFGVPQVELFQDSLGVYQAGQSYQLTVAALGKLATGNSMNINLYYRDSSITEGDNRVAIATTTITNTGQFGTGTHFLDFTAATPLLTGAEPYIGKDIGVQLISSPLADGSGYWDLDNVRLTAVPEPAALTLLAVGFAGLLLRRRR